LETAIIDGADEVSDPERGVFRLSEIDMLLEIEGVAESISRVRQAFSFRVQAELARRCRVLGKTQPDGLVAESLKYPAEPPSALAVEDDPTVVPLAASRSRPRFGYARRPGMP
jgi:hypothetical protein